MYLVIGFSGLNSTQINDYWDIVTTKYFTVLQPIDFGARTMLEKRIYNNYHNQTNPKTSPNKNKTQNTHKKASHIKLLQKPKRTSFKTRPKEGN